MASLHARATSVAASALAFLLAPAAHAALLVTDCSSDADLRAKLAQLQTGPGGKLKFSCGPGQKTIVLTGGPLPLTKNVTIDGKGRISLSGGNATPIFEIAASAKVTLRELIVTLGRNTTGNGGAIVNAGKLVVERCLLTKNEATVGSGSAILSLGPLRIVDSTFSENKAANGGALYPRFAAAQTTITRSTFTANETTSTTDGWGGAILVWDGAEVTLSFTGFDLNKARHGGAVYVQGGSMLFARGGGWNQNTALDRGGAIFNDGNGQVDVTLGGFFDNEADGGGAVFNDGFLEIERSSLGSNTATSGGGAVRNRGTANIVESGLHENEVLSGGGGAIENHESLSLINTTLLGNKAQDGGGLYNGDEDSFAGVLNSTLFENEAAVGGGVNFSGGAVKLLNSIVAGSTGTDCARNAGSSGVITTQGFNISGDSSCGFDLSSDQEDTDPELGVGLAGTSFAARPLPGSPAIDKGTVAGCPDVDQGGTERPRGATCDVGAIESCGRAKPAAFALVWPADGQTVKTTMPILEWEVASCATIYETTVRFDSPTGPIAASSRLPFPFASPALTNNRTYFWQVKSCNGGQCRRSPWASFKVKSR